MTYSCAYFATPQTPLADAQRAKYDLICRKLGLRPGMRLLDVGCGWGGMVMHAAEHYGVQAVGVTVSQRQVDYGREAVAAAGLDDRVEIRFQDYRDVVRRAVRRDLQHRHGRARRAPSSCRSTSSSCHGLLRPGGRLLNHGICWPRGSAGLSRNSFVANYVFPDGELHEVGVVAQAMQARGFEVRDDESLREHYALTLRHWVGNLEEHWDEAVRIAGAGRARVWRLYMAGSALNFESGNITVHQVLGVRPYDDGRAGDAADAGGTARLSRAVARRLPTGAGPGGTSRSRPARLVCLAHRAAAQCFVARPSQYRLMAWNWLAPSSPASASTTSPWPLPR